MVRINLILFSVFCAFISFNSVGQIKVDTVYTSSKQLSKLVYHSVNKEHLIDSVQIFHQNDWVTSEKFTYNNQDKLVRSEILDTFSNQVQILDFNRSYGSNVLKDKEDGLSTELVFPTVNGNSLNSFSFSDNSKYYVVRGDPQIFELNNLRSGKKIFALEGNGLDRFENIENWYSTAWYKPSNTGRYVFYFDGIEGNFIFDFLKDSLSFCRLPEQYYSVNDGLESSLISQDDKVIYLIGKQWISSFDFRNNSFQNIYEYNPEGFDYDIDESRINALNEILLIGKNGFVSYNILKNELTVNEQFNNETIIKQSGDFILTMSEKENKKGITTKTYFIRNVRDGNKITVKNNNAQLENESSILMETEHGVFFVSNSLVKENAIQISKININSGKIEFLSELAGYFYHDKISFPKLASDEIILPVNTSLGIKNVVLNFANINFKYNDDKNLTSPNVVFNSITSSNKVILQFEKPYGFHFGIGIDFKNLNNYFSFDTEEYLQNIKKSNGGKLSKTEYDYFMISEGVLLEDSLWKSGNYWVNYSDQDAARLFVDPLANDYFADLGNTFEVIKYREDKILIKTYQGLLHVNSTDEQPLENAVNIIVTHYKDVMYVCRDNYYALFGSLSNQIYFSQDLKAYPLEQFDLKYNRPDIILDRLGYADSALVAAYYAAYQKRLKKMGFTEDMLEDNFHLPEIEIENFEEMPKLHDQGSIHLKLNLKDSKYKLDRINVWVNDVAIYGTNGISLRNKNVQEYTTDLEVFLTKGKNKVQVSVLNQAGAESYKETFEVNCTAGKDQPDLYLITIGESEFQQSDYNLTYAAKDAQDMVKLFEKNKFYNEVFSKTLINEQVTREKVLALRSFLEQADINDEVMIFIAGHGVLDANLDYYFATYNMDFMNPADKGLAYEDLESLLDGINPLKKTLLIDACHSGEIDKEEVELAEADIKEGDDIQFRVVGNTALPKLGTQNTSELTKTLFTDLRKGTGATVISSAGGMEFAMEGDDWNNGLFTYCFINGIKSKAADYNNDGEIWLSEIQQYVSQQVYKLSGGRQQPTSRIENQSVDFRVW